MPPPQTVEEPAKTSLPDTCREMTLCRIAPIAAACVLAQPAGRSPTAEVAPEAVESEVRP